ncbi:MAG: type II toxin-antitoxin system VapC family toxin [Desulfitobacteriaceae bacterium]
MNVMIDTNVILDAGLNRRPFNAFAEKILLLVADEKVNASITASSVTDIYYFLRRDYQNSDRAKEMLINFFNIFEVIDVTKSDCEKALGLPMDDYEDALLATCAKRRRIELIITRNLKDFAESPVKAISPDDFLTNYF